MKVELTIGESDLRKAVEAFIKEELDLDVVVVEENPPFPSAIKFTVDKEKGEMP